MAQNMVAFAFFAAVLLHVSTAQSLNRFLPIGSPNCGCSNVLPVEYANQIFYNSPVALDSAIAPMQGPMTIIQDSTVANNLANALQLLVVSNLLANTLPLSPDPLVELAPLAAPLAAPYVAPYASPCASPCASPYAAAQLASPYAQIGAQLGAQLGLSSCGCNRPAYGGCGGCGGYNILY